MIVLNENVVKSNFGLYLDNVLETNDTLKIISQKGNSFLVSEDNWNSLNETLNLLKDKISLDALLEGHIKTINNIPQETYSLSEVIDGL